MEKGGLIVLISLLFLILTVNIVSASVEGDFLNLINNERTKLGKSVVSYNDNLNQAALSHSKEMAENDYFSHDSIDGTTFDKRIIIFGYTSYISLGENIAYASGGVDADRIFNMWKNSPSHYSNMISDSFNEIGLGIYLRSGRTYYTLDLGKRNNIEIPAPVIDEPVIKTPETNPAPIIDKPVVPPIIDDSSLFSTIDTTITQSKTYRFIKIKGTLNERSVVYYEMGDKLHRVCSSCNKFSFYIRTKDENKIILKLNAMDKLKNSETRILEIKSTV